MPTTIALAAPATPRRPTVYEYELRFLGPTAAGSAFIEATSMRNAKKELAMDVRGAVVTSWSKTRLPDGWRMGGRV